MWKAKALEAHREREGIAPVLIGLGAIEAALGGVFLVTSDRHDTLEAGMDVSAIAVGAGVALWGIVASRGETDTELRLHEYERAVGRSIVQDVGFRIVPAPSGAALGVTGRFD
jgi:hypothetical protein